MTHEIIEVKARCADLARARRTLAERTLKLSQVEHQMDTYFRCGVGRLKLRENGTRTILAYYLRPDVQGPKRSCVTLYCPSDDAVLKSILTNALGVLVVVEKSRETYVDGNVEIHLDQVLDLGSFVEIEVKNEGGVAGEVILREQCRFYMNLLGIRDVDTIEASYCDLIAEADPSRASFGCAEDFGEEFADQRRPFAGTRGLSEPFLVDRSRRIR